MALALVAIFLTQLDGQRLEQAECDVDRLEVLRLDIRDITAKSADRGGGRGGHHRLVAKNSNRAYPCQPTRRDRFDIALDAGDLSGKEEPRVLSRRKIFVQDLRRIDERVAMDLTELQELGILQTGYESKHSGLLAVSQMVLTTDEPVCVGHQILLSELDTCIRLVTRFWVRQTFRLHRSEPERLNTASGDLLDRQTAFEPTCFLKTLERDRFRFEQLADEPLVLIAIHRTVNVI